MRAKGFADTAAAMAADWEELKPALARGARAVACAALPLPPLLLLLLSGGGRGYRSCERISGGSLCRTHRACIIIARLTRDGMGSAQLELSKQSVFNGNTFSNPVGDGSGTLYN